MRVYASTSANLQGGPGRGWHRSCRRFELGRDLGRLFVSAQLGGLDSPAVSSDIFIERKNTAFMNVAFLPREGLC